MKNKIKALFFLVSTLLPTWAWSAPLSPMVPGKTILLPLDKMGCPSFRDELFENLQMVLLRTGSVPSAAELKATLQSQLQELTTLQEQPELRDKLETELTEFYQLLTVAVPQEMSAAGALELKRTLGALKVGDRSTEAANALQEKIGAKLKGLQALLIPLGLNCIPESKGAPYFASEMQNKATENQVPFGVLGIRRAMATAYQSCQSLTLAPMTRAVPALEGVEDAGPYPGGGGRLRKITDQAALAKSHYYVQNFTPAPNCVDVKQKTLIYDYGGKPYTTSEAQGPLNYWKNNSDGSKGLGIDCSGFVFTSIAAGGLRLVKGKQLKAHEVDDYPARMYVDAENNGFTCFEKAKMGKNLDLKPGDIAATQYHIVIIDSVGKDPLAIRKYKNCDRISYRDFDFVIAQSSPEQNAIGINRYDAREYLAQKLLNPIQAGFVAYAKAACEAFQAGRDLAAGDRSFGIIRHKMTPDCLQKEIDLVGASCVDSCHELYNQ